MSKQFGLNYLKMIKQISRNEEELELHMQLDYKQAVEIAEEASYT